MRGGTVPPSMVSVAPTSVGNGAERRMVREEWSGSAKVTTPPNVGSAMA